MRIVPYMTRSIKGHSVETIPLQSPDPEDDPGFFIVRSHDRGPTHTGPFFHTVFRVEDADGVAPGDLVLRYEGYAGEVPQLTYKARWGHWAQPDNASVNSAGIYQVALYRRGSGTAEHRIRIQIIPSNLSFDDYMSMLSDLISIHEDLVLNLNSTVSAAHTASASYQTDHLDQLAELIRTVMQLPSEIQKKEYVRCRPEHLRRIDARVARDLARRAPGEKVLTAVYREDHDTYENRVIRYVLEQLRSRLTAWKSKQTDPEKTEQLLSGRIEVEMGSMATMLHRDLWAQGSQNEQKLRDADRLLHDRKDQLVARLKAERHFYERVGALTALLDRPWFREISLLPGLPELKLTSKFRYHRLYHRIYELIRDLLKEHPVISCQWNAELMGVNATHDIYEYWVFYKLLYHLLGLGFHLDTRTTGPDDQTRGLQACFRDFIRHIHTKSSAGLALDLIKDMAPEPIRVRMGYEILYRNKSDEKDILCPDYSLIISYGRKHALYILDAKYKPFTGDGRDGTFDYHEELQKVAVNKYRGRLGRLLNCNGSISVRGSYLVVPDILEENHDLSENNRLYGRQDGLCSPEPGTDPLPRHRFGVIRLSPSCDEELTTLFQMIFEFMMTGQDQDSPLLDHCWRCGEKLTREIYETRSGFKKYYSTCPRCGAFRVDTHCGRHGCNKLIVKHTVGNYHTYDTGDRMPDGKHWAYFCPSCGNGLTGSG